MPRVYKPNPGGKRYKKYDDLLMEQAIKELSNSRTTTIIQIAKKYNISKSVLHRHATKDMKTQGGQLAIPLETEEYIVEYLNICAEWGYPLNTLDLRYIIKMYLDALSIHNKRFKDNFPGPDYVHGFLNRHKNKISQRICQNIKRARAAVSPSVVNEYFDELEKSLEGIMPQNVVNFDETNLSDDPGRTKVITKRGCKYPERVVNHSKSSVSLMLAGTAEGKLLAPYVVYKSTHLYDTWVKNGPPETRFNRSKSGWFDGDTFDDWIKKVVIPYFKNIPGKKLLIGDNLSSHLSVESIKMCMEQDINFAFLPANSTHITQPLDVAFFRPMKCIWRNILLKWKKSDGRTYTCVPKGCFPRLLKMLMEQLSQNSAQNLQSGFRKTGIYPLNRNEVLDRLPKEGENEEAVKEAIDESVLRLLKEMRYGTIGVTEPKKKRKVEIVAGKSVSMEDLENNVEKEPAHKKKKTVTAVEGPSYKTDLNKKTNKGKGKGKKSKQVQLKEMQEKDLNDLDIEKLPFMIVKETEKTQDTVQFDDIQKAVKEAEKKIRKTDTAAGPSKIKLVKNYNKPETIDKRPKQITIKDIQRKDHLDEETYTQSNLNDLDIEKLPIMIVEVTEKTQDTVQFDDIQEAEKEAEKKIGKTDTAAGPSKTNLVKNNEEKETIGKKSKRSTSKEEPVNDTLDVGIDWNNDETSKNYSMKEDNFIILNEFIDHYEEVITTESQQNISKNCDANESKSIKVTSNELILPDKMPLLHYSKSGKKLLSIQSKLTVSKQKNRHDVAKSGKAEKKNFDYYKDEEDILRILEEKD